MLEKANQLLHNSQACPNLRFQGMKTGTELHSNAPGTETCTYSPGLQSMCYRGALCCAEEFRGEGREEERRGRQQRGKERKIEKGGGTEGEKTRKEEEREREVDLAVSSLL